MKKLISVFLSICMMLSVISYGAVFASAEGGTIDKTEVTWEYDSQTKVLTFGGNGAIPSYELSADVSEHFVVEYPWKDLEYTSIVFGDGITAVGDDSFCFSKALASVTIPETITSIGSEAFRGCEALTDVSIASGADISENCFYECPALKSVVISGNSKSVGDSAFFNCKLLDTITLPEGLEAIGQSAFFSCEALTEVSLPDSVKSIGNSAFSGCKKLETITMSSKLDTLGESAFNDCTALKSLEFFNGLSVIPNELCSGCTSLESVVIPESVYEIGSFAFLLCTSLKNIYIPSGVMKIGERAVGFGSRGALVADFVLNCYDNSVAQKYADTNNITVSSLGKAVSGYCGKDVKWTFDNGILKLSGNGKTYDYSADNLAYFTTYVNSEIINCCEIESGITYLGDYLLYRQNSLQSFELMPENCTTLEEIGNYTFYNCGSELAIRPEVKKIGEKAIGNFTDGNLDKGCSIMCEKGSYAHKYALANGYEFSNTVFEYVYTGKCGDDITWDYDKSTLTLSFIGTGAMYNYSPDNLPQYANLSINDIFIDARITEIGSYAFIDFNGGDYYIPHGVTKIGEKAFGYDCDSELNTVKNSGKFNLYSYDDSPAKEYANANSLDFVNLGAFNGLSGKVGDNITWEYDENERTLKLIGVGVTYNYTDSKLSDFAHYPIDSIEIDSNITALGDYVLANTLEGVATICLTENIKSIGKFALGYSVAPKYDSANQPTGEYISLKNPTFTIKGYADTAAEQYAEDNEFDFEAMTFSAPVTGSCGKNATWTYDSESSTLTISGSGEIYNYTSENPPLYTTEMYGFTIDKIIVEDGITSIGDYAFYAIGKEITVPESVTKIGEKAFGFGDGAITDFTIKGYNGSAANTFATENNLKYVSLNKAEYKLSDDKPMFVKENNIIVLYQNQLSAADFLKDYITCTNCEAKLSKDIIGTNTVLTVSAESESLAELQFIVNGDVNGDGKTNSSDALLVLQHAVGLASLDGNKFTAADINEDKYLRSNDALEILKIAVGLKTQADFIPAE